MSAWPQKTPRGFNIFGRVEGRDDVFRFQESSIAGEGAHVWIFLGDCNDNGVEGCQLNVAQAKAAIEALSLFVRMAEAGELTEPAVLPEHRGGSPGRE